MLASGPEGRPRSRSQGGREPSGLAEHLKRVENARADDVPALKRFHRSTLALHDNNAECGCGEHPTIVAAVSDCDDAVKVERCYVVELGEILTFGGCDGEHRRQICEASCGEPECICRDDVNFEFGGQGAKDIGDAWEENAIDRHRPVVVEYEMVEFEATIARNVDHDHAGSMYAAITCRKMQARMAASGEMYGDG